MRYIVAIAQRLQITAHLNFSPWIFERIHFYTYARHKSRSLYSSVQPTLPSPSLFSTTTSTTLCTHLELFPINQYAQHNPFLNPLLEQKKIEWLEPRRNSWWMGNGKAGLFLLLRRALHHSLALVPFGRDTGDGVWVLVLLPILLAPLLYPFPLFSSSSLLSDQNSDKQEEQ